MGRNLMAGLALLTVISVLYILMGFTTEVWEEEVFGAPSRRHSLAAEHGNWHVGTGVLVGSVAGRADSSTAR